MESLWQVVIQYIMYRQELKHTSVFILHLWQLASVNRLVALPSDIHTYMPHELENIIWYKNEIQVFWVVHRLFNLQAHTLRLGSHWCSASFLLRFQGSWPVPVQLRLHAIWMQLQFWFMAWGLSPSGKQLRNTAQTSTKCSGIALSLNAFCMCFLFNSMELKIAKHHSKDAQAPF